VSLTEELAIEITDYLRGEREPVQDWELVRRIMADAAYNAAWTKAKEVQWTAAIDEAVKRGLIVREGALLSLPKVVAKQKVEQLDLF
jgi:hypothetical protein